MAYLRHGLILLYQKACQKASIRARFSHNFLFREGLRLILGKPPESGSARLGHIPSLPWESQLPLKPCISLHPSDFEGNCDSSDFLLDFCCSFIVQFDLLRKCGLLAHTSAAFLKNCCTEKLLVCLRLVLCNTPLQTKKHRRSDAFSRFILSIYSVFLIKCVQNSSVLPW